jgi:flagellin
MIGSLSNTLGSANSAITTALNQLSAGQRITSASDDPAGSQIAAQLVAQIGSTGAALSSISDASSLAQTAGSALGQVSDVLQQMRDLAVQAGDGAYSASDRQALQAQFNQLSVSLDGVSRQSQFNGQNLLDGTFNTSIPLGPNSGQVLTISLGNTSASALGVAEQNITSVSGATSATSSTDQALAIVTAQQANLGAAQSTLDATTANLSTSSLNLSASLSGVADTNVAQVSSNLASASIRQQVALQAIRLYNANQSQVLAFIAPQSK